MEQRQREKSAREIAVHLLNEIEKKKSYSNLLLNSVLSKTSLSKLDRAFATELFYGVLRTQNTLDWVIDQFSKRKSADIKMEILNILRLGIYQLLFMDKVPVSAACNESTEIAKKYGHAGIVKFVNGVLRNIARKKDEIVYPSLEADPIKHISLQYSHPAWLVKRWVERYGVDETLALCKANNTIPPMAVRVNSLKLNRESLLAELEKEDVEAKLSSISPDGVILEKFQSIDKTQAYHQGLFQVQDEGSMLIARLLEPKAGEKLLDACAAPGGKTTHLAQLMQNEGEVVAVDLHPHKIELIKAASARLGIKNIVTYCSPAQDLPKKYAEYFDRILVDAPCSGLGVIRRKPELRWRKKPEQIKEFAALQFEILSAAAKCLRKGGVLVYSTCTTEPEENTLLIEKFLADNSAYKLVDINPFLQAAKIDADGSKGYIQLLPHIHGTDGFFMAKMIKE